MHPASLQLPAAHAAEHNASWLDRCIAWRDRLLGSVAFRRFAARFSLTRPFARRAAHDLFDLCAGFVYSQVLLACVRLSLFERLSERPQTAAELAATLALPIEACERLLRAAVALNLLEERRGARFGLGRLGAAMLDNEEAAAMIEHNAVLYGDLADPLALLRNGSAGSKLSACWPYAAPDATQRPSGETVSNYSRLMTASQGRLCEQVLDAFPLEWNRVLLDVGGGEGAFVTAAAKRYAHLRLKTFDLPEVAERARGCIAKSGMARRIEAHGGDFFRDALPAGADIITLLRVLFDHDDASAVRILEAAHQALPRGGTLLVAEPMAGSAGPERVGDAYFGVYLLAMGRGRPRSREAIGALLAKAGFSAIQSVPLSLSLGNGLIMARA